MSNYLIKKDKYSASINYMEYDLDGYIFKPKNRNTKSYIKVKQVKIVKNDMISNLLMQKFEKNFQRLGQIIVNFLYQDESEADEGDFIVLLDEVARLKSVVEIKYRKHLGIEKYREYINELHFLDNQIRQKLAIINFRNSFEYHNNYEMEETKGRSL